MGQGDQPVPPPLHPQLCSRWWGGVHLPATVFLPQRAPLQSSSMRPSAYPPLGLHLLATGFSGTPSAPLCDTCSHTARVICTVSLPAEDMLPSYRQGTAHEESMIASRSLNSGVQSWDEDLGLSILSIWDLV